MVRDSRTALNKFAQEAYDQVAWYILNDELSPMRQVDWTDGAGVSAPSWWVPGVGKQLSSGDPEMEIIPDSMIERTSEEQAGALLESIHAVVGLMAAPGNRPVFLNHQEVVNELTELRNQPKLKTMFGEAPDVSSLVPGSETAGATMQSGSQPPASSPASPGDKLKEKLMFQATQPTGAQGY
jgi:hypothetical protein